MEERKKEKERDERDKEILFSRTIKAGQRIYYVDVKQNRKNDMYLSITESKKMVSNDTELPQVSYEKHKIFLYREDFLKFCASLDEAIQYVNSQQGEANPRKEKEETEKEIKIDMEF